MHIRRVVDLGREYHIPFYQRGYKWTVAEVCKLLSDIYHFDGQRGDYCLQNITLLKKDGGFNVIDGQQRLTTTLILLAYLRNEQIDNPPKEDNLKIHYGIRENTDKFIASEILSGRIWDSVPTIKDDAWNKLWLAPASEESKRYAFFKNKLEEWRNSGLNDRDHQDIYHIFCAAMAIEAWFSHTGENKRQFKSKFLDRVIFIINEIMHEADEAKIFSKINGFRVPLDGADLLRGIFVTEVAREQSGMGNTELNEQRVKIGLDLDSINAWWSAPERKQYFKFFSSVTDVDGVFNSEKYPINQLYKLYVETKGKTTITIDDFEKGIFGLSSDNSNGNRFGNILHGVKELHRTMQDWYEDRQIYHYVGFILAQLKKSSFCEKEKTPFLSLWKLWSDPGEAPLRTDFIRRLKTIIADGIFADKEPRDGNSEDLWIRRIRGEEDFDWYSSDKTLPFLILLDVLAYADPDQDKSEGNMHLGKRMNAEFFENYRGMEDKEHIFPQTPIADYDLRGKGKTCEIISRHIERYWELICETAKKTSGKNADVLLEEWRTFWQEKTKADPEDDPFPIDRLTQDWFERLQNDRNKRESVQRIINDFIFKKCNIHLNSIGNIVLLRRGTNRSYGNDFYSVKRKYVLQDYRSHLSIRFHTRAVFAMEFLPKDDETEDFDYWGQDSIRQNAASIAHTLLEAFPRIEQ